MGRRILPPKTKQQTTIFLDYTLFDALVLLIYTFLIYLLASTTFFFTLKILSIVVLIILMILSLMPVGEMKGYSFLFHLIGYWLRRKKTPGEDIKKPLNMQFYENYFEVAGYKTAAIRILGIDFGILTERKQDGIIYNFGQILKSIKIGKFIKLDLPIDLDEYLSDIENNGAMWDEIKKKDNTDPKYYEIRDEILEKIYDNLDYVNNYGNWGSEVFYIVIQDRNEEILLNNLEVIKQSLLSAQLDCSIAQEEELREMLEFFFETPFTCSEEEKEEEFIIPTIKEGSKSIYLGENGYRIISYDTNDIMCDNAWLWPLFSIPEAKVVLNFSQTAEKRKVFKSINKAIVELEGRYIAKTATETSKMEIDVMVSLYRSLLEQLRYGSELMHNVSLYVMYPKDNKEEVETQFVTNSFSVNQLYFRQMAAFQNMIPYNMEDKPMKYLSKEYPTSTFASGFPFVNKLFMDKKGVYIGTSYNKYPIFFNLFASWQKLSNTRTNANMVIMGKPGSGKSFFMKHELLQELLTGKSIYILDPENEYEYMVEQLKGNWIDIGGTSSGIINPFNVFPSLEYSKEEEVSTAEVSAHRQFLQEFFKLVMPNLDKECMTYLNAAISELYDNFGIFDSSDLTKLNSEDYPTMEDLYLVVNNHFSSEQLLEYDKTCWRKLLNELQDFKTGGLHAKLWNGHTTLKLENKFTVLNFQSLFANSNNLVANGQMLLVMRFLLQEIIKNRNTNMRNIASEDDNNIIIAVDEAHMFINPDFPIALDFMAQMTKRIRKYGGSIIVGTQNIKDFIGHNEATRTKATAVINGCQYSTIFGLAPDDVNSVKDLFSSYNGGLNETEVDYLSDAVQGQALMIIDANTRLTAHIETYAEEVDYFEKPKY